jgi:hypothetical protein
MLFMGFSKILIKSPEEGGMIDPTFHVKTLMHTKMD